MEETDNNPPPIPEDEPEPEPLTTYITIKPSNSYVAQMKEFWENISIREQEEDRKRRNQGPPPMVDLST